MGSTQATRDLVAHVEKVHGWDLPYINHAKARAQHEASHRWGVPEPESSGPWSIYLDSRTQPPTVWD
jgi:hypothetical protein